MPAATVQLGMNAKLYINTGNTYIAPANFGGNTVFEVTNVRDLTLNLSKATADVTTRGNGGWRATVGTLKDGSVSFEMIADPTDTYYEAIRDAWLNETPTQFAVFSGALTTPAVNTEGLVAVFSVNEFTRAEPLEGAQITSVTMTPTYITNTSFKPAWKEVASS